MSTLADFVGGSLGLLVDVVAYPLQRRRRRREQAACWHHDRATGETWMREQMTNGGAGKMRWCDRCLKTEFV